MRKSSAVDLDSQKVKTARSTISGDNPATGPLGLSVRPPHLDLPLRMVMYRFELPYVNPVLRTLLGNSYKLKGVQANRPVVVWLILFANRSVPHLALPR